MSRIVSNMEDKIIVNKEIDKFLLTLKDNNVSLEGNVWRAISSSNEDVMNYLQECVKLDKETRQRRINNNKDLQIKNNELLKIQREKEDINRQLKISLEQSENSVKRAKEDIEILQKKNKMKIVNNIIRYAILVITGILILSTTMYIILISRGIQLELVSGYYWQLLSYALSSFVSILAAFVGVRELVKKEEM